MTAAADPRATARRTAPPTHLLTRPGERVTGHEFHRTTVTPAARPSRLDRRRRAGRLRERDPARVVPPHALGRPPPARRAVRRGGHACRPRRAAALDVAPDDADRLTTGPTCRHHGDPEVARRPASTSRSTCTPARGRPGSTAPCAPASTTSRSYPDATAARRGRSPRGTAATPTRCWPPPAPPRRSRCVARLRPWRQPGGRAPAVHRARRGARGTPATTSPRSCSRRRRLPARPGRRARGRRPRRGRQPDQPDRRAAPGATLLASLAPAGPGGGRRRGVHGRRARRAGVARSATPGVLVRAQPHQDLVDRRASGPATSSATPAHLAELPGEQPPWSVSTPAAAAMVACSTAEARAEADRRALRGRRLARRCWSTGWPPAGWWWPATRPRRSCSCTARPGCASGSASRASRSVAATPSRASAPDWVRIAVRDPGDDGPAAGRPSTGSRWASEPGGRAGARLRRRPAPRRPRPVAPGRRLRPGGATARGRDLRRSPVRGRRPRAGARRRERRCSGGCCRRPRRRPRCAPGRSSAAAPCPGRRPLCTPTFAVATSTPPASRSPTSSAATPPGWTPARSPGPRSSRWPRTPATPSWLPCCGARWPVRGTARLPRGEHPGRDGRAPQPALRAVRLGGRAARRRRQPGAGPGHRARWPPRRARPRAALRAWRRDARRAPEPERRRRWRRPSPARSVSGWAGRTSTATTSRTAATSATAGHRPRPTSRRPCGWPTGSRSSSLLVALAIARRRARRRPPRHRPAPWVDVRRRR